MQTQDILTPSELDAQLALEATSTVDLLKRLASIAEQERLLSIALTNYKKTSQQIEELVLKRMLMEDTNSITVTTDAGLKMRFTVSSRTFPKMVNGSLAAAEALTAYAERLSKEGRHDEADDILGMLTIKGQSLAPMLNEWMLEDMPLPPEFEGAIESSMRISLSKRKA
jgi:hypothetical protein